MLEEGLGFILCGSTTSVLPKESSSSLMLRGSSAKTGEGLSERSVDRAEQND